jgi:hypothetical protein
MIWLGCMPDWMAFRALATSSGCCVRKYLLRVRVLEKLT